MSTILLSNFTGILPRMSDSLLPDNAGQVARNVKLQSGEIRPWRKPVKVQPVLQKGVKSIFKMEGTGGETLWCEWVNDTDVCYGPVADQEEFRIYYSEGGVCKKTNWKLASEGDGVAPRNWYYLGTPYPDGKPTLKANRVPNDKQEWEEKYPDKPYEEYSADNTENRVYAYTYVSEFGDVVEESAPSEAAEVTCDVTGGSVEVSGFIDPPTDHLNITRIRLYRAVMGSSSVIYKLVDELPLKEHKYRRFGRLWQYACGGDDSPAVHDLRHASVVDGTGKAADDAALRRQTLHRLRPVRRHLRVTLRLGCHCGRPDGRLHARDHYAG